jgi:hypothetical protein
MVANHQGARDQGRMSPRRRLRVIGVLLRTNPRTFFDNVIEVYIMQRPLQSVLRLGAVRALTAGLLLSSFALPATTAFAQQQSLKDQLVGAWTLISAVDVRADGSRVNPWGANPKGAYTFDANGLFVQVVMRSDLPKFAKRAEGTPEQNRAVVQGSISYYGTYSINEADKIIDVHINGSSFAAANDTDAKRIIASLTADEMTIINLTTSTGADVKSESVWKRVK